jgi:hypothetical protein
MKLYYQITVGELYENDDLVDEIYRNFSKDNAYATINDNTDDIYSVQYYQFDRQLQPLSYFLKK